MNKIFTSLLALSLALTACGGQSQTTGKLKVVATFYPLAYFAERIGGDLVQVSNLVPTGGEPHDFEPSPRQIVEVTEADVALYLGLGFEPWIEDLETELDAKGVVVVEVNSKLPLVPGSEESEAAYDPHTWLDPLLAQEMVSMISSAFVRANPEGKASYEANAETLLRELQDLHEVYQSSLQNCEGNTILTSHDAFTYLANRYGIETVSVAGLSPEDEPSADRLVELADFAKAHESQYIFFETLANPDVAQTLADEADLTPLLFNPIEGLTSEEAQTGKTYFSLMQDNLVNLKLALSCPEKAL